MDFSSLVLVAGLVLIFPIIAIVALVKVSNLRSAFEDYKFDTRLKIERLEGDVARLGRVLAEFAKPAEQATPAPGKAIPSAPPPPAPTPAPTIHVATPVPIEPFVAPKPIAPSPPPPEPKPVAPPSPPPAPSPQPVAIPQAPPPRPVQVFTFAEQPPRPPRKTLGEILRSTLPLEELLGLNLFARIGIVLLVLGFAFLGQLAFTSMGHGARSALIFSVGAILLGGGVFLEHKDRYKLVGRAGIGGGWALLFFTTYAIHHVAAMAVIQSNTLDCILMLVVAAGMVAHTLRYKSQVVTGLAFLLAFSTVALSQDSVYALAAGVILALAIVAIVLRMGWFELEVFGIAASYANHFYWLYKLYPDGFAGHAFPQFWPSVLILCLYWLVFRLSYVFRRIAAPRDEKISTLAALLNTTLLGVVMRFQSTHPELTFYALLGMGLVEFAFGQLPVTRRRRAAFVLLTLVGTLLVFAAVPFRFTGNDIALFWMIAAEALLIAGIVQSEVLFRRLGLVAGGVTGVLIAWEARGIVEFRQHSDAVMLSNGILLLTCCVLFYANALWVRARWHSLFGVFEGALAALQSYLGMLTAFLGVWALFPGEWTAIGWGVLLLATVYGLRRLADNHLFLQSGLLALATTAAAAAVNLHWEAFYPHHVAMRLISVPIIAALYYVAAALLAADGPFRSGTRTFSLWAGSALLALLAWFEINPVWLAPAWMAFAVALALLSRRLRSRDLAFQEHVLALAVAAQLLFVNLYASAALERYMPIAVCAAALYAISRFCTVGEDVYRRPAAWAHTWIATALLATLAWHESPQPWLCSVWAIFALALALIDRWIDAEELPSQAHLLALLSVISATTFNLFDTGQWHGIDRRLITVTLLVAVLYTLARCVRMPQSIRAAGWQHIYTWIGSALFAWMLWSELQPVAVAVGFALFGLALFEFGDWRRLTPIRLQGYVVLTAAFVRIFFVNLTAAPLPGEHIGPRIFTVAPIALILFYVWARLDARKEPGEIRGWTPRELFAYFGTASVVALLYFEVAPEWIVVAWSVVVLALLAAGYFLRREVFLQQVALLIIGITARGFAHNLFGGSYFTSSGWRGNFLILSIASIVLLGSLRLAFAVRTWLTSEPPTARLSRLLAVHRLDQWLFFSPLVLVGVMIFVRMDPGMVTLAWGVEGLLAIVLGLFASQRSYRIAGLALLLLCVAKIVALDAWRLSQRDRYITFIVLGAALILVSTLYGRFRDTVRKLL
jgi:hypothetical protein